MCCQCLGSRMEAPHCLRHTCTAAMFAQTGPRQCTPAHLTCMPSHLSVQSFLPNHLARRPSTAAALEHRAIAYAGEPLLWDPAQRQQMLRELVQLGGAVEAAFGGVPQVGAQLSQMPGRHWIQASGFSETSNGAVAAAGGTMLKMDAPLWLAQHAVEMRLVTMLRCAVLAAIHGKLLLLTPVRFFCTATCCAGH